MKSPKEQYTDEMKNKFGYYATWLPGKMIQLGDVGVIRDNEFVRLKNLKDDKISFEVLQGDSTLELEYSTQNEVTVTTKVAGKVAPQGSALGELDAGIIVEFGKSNSIFFKAGEITNNMLSNTVELGDTILKLFGEGKWDKNWVVITELIHAKNGTILISNSNQAKVELKANAEVGVKQKIDIGDAKLDLSISYSKGMATKIVSESNLTPLFKVMGIKTKWFKNKFTPMEAYSRDLLTPDNSKNDLKDVIYFGNISENVWE